MQSLKMSSVNMVDNPSTKKTDTVHINDGPTITSVTPNASQYPQRNNQHPEMQNPMTRTSMSHPNQTKNARQECTDVVSLVINITIVELEIKFVLFVISISFMGVLL